MSHDGQPRSPTTSSTHRPSPNTDDNQDLLTTSLDRGRPRMGEALPPYAELHALLVIAGTLTYWRLFVADPPKIDNNVYFIQLEKYISH